MPLPEHKAVAPHAPPPRQMGRGLFWAMLALVVVLVGTSTVAMLGWSAAINRADEQASRAAALRSASDRADGLQQTVAATQKELAAAQAREVVLETQLTDSKALLAEAQDKVSAAQDRADAAEKAFAAAEQTRGQLQARLDTASSAIARVVDPVASPQPASNISAQSTIAPELPLPGLPPGATPRDYLVAAQQAVREGRSGRAQAALERAETRLLNQASLAGKPAHPAARVGVSEIEQALDQLGKGNTEAALQTINGLLTRHSVAAP